MVAIVLLIEPQKTQLQAPNAEDNIKNLLEKMLTTMKETRSDLAAVVIEQLEQGQDRDQTISRVILALFVAIAEIGERLVGRELVTEGHLTGRGRSTIPLISIEINEGAARVVKHREIEINDRDVLIMIAVI